MSSSKDTKGMAVTDHVSEQYNATSERINNALHKIRSELTEIRDQDLKLLKQLIQISETIKKLSDDRLSKRQTWYGQRQSLCSESADVFVDIDALTPDLDDYREAILFRQLSEPTSFSRKAYLDPTTSTAIFDTSVCVDGMNNCKAMEQIWPTDISKLALRHRPHSVSILMSDKTYSMENSLEWQGKSDKSYAEILERNIRLWKGNLNSSGSDGDDDGAHTPVNEQAGLDGGGYKNYINSSNCGNTSVGDGNSIGKDEITATDSDENTLTMRRFKNTITINLNNDSRITNEVFSDETYCDITETDIVTRGNTEVNRERAQFVDRQDNAEIRGEEVPEKGGSKVSLNGKVNVSESEQQHSENIGTSNQNDNNGGKISTCSLVLRPRSLLPIISQLDHREHRHAPNTH